MCPFQIFSKYGQVLKIVTFSKNSKYQLVSLSFSQCIYIVGWLLYAYIEGEVFLDFFAMQVAYLCAI